VKPKLKLNTFFGSELAASTSNNSTDGIKKLMYRWVGSVVEIIIKIPDFLKLKMDPEIVNYCCNVVENLIKKEDKKEINKLNLVTSILIKAWDLKEEADLDYIIKTNYQV
jgi:hypothetical protein